MVFKAANLKVIVREENATIKQLTYGEKNYMAKGAIQLTVLDS